MDSLKSQKAEPLFEHITDKDMILKWTPKSYILDMS